LPPFNGLRLVTPRSPLHIARAVVKACLSGGIAAFVLLGGQLLAVSESAVAAEVVPWLYEVSVPVESQSSQERARASGEALLTLLTRLTGMAHVPRTDQVNAAVNAAERYYNEFSYASGPDDTLELVIRFDAGPVQTLVRDAGLPIWRSSRERVVAWVVVQEPADRVLVGATSPSPLVTGLEKRALERGVPLTVPLLDLEDELAVDPSAVWGRLSQVVDPASERYGADVLLLGRVVPTEDGGWSSDWEFWVDGEVVPFTEEGADLESHGIAAVDVLADELAARRVVHGSRVGQLLVAVSGIGSPSDYGHLLRYLRSLEFVDRVGVSGIRDDRLWLTVDTRADPEQLLATLERDGRAYPDQLAMVQSADLRLVWRGSD
jgi:hypothetical protein